MTQEPNPWEVVITAPNGTKTHIVLASNEDHTSIIGRFAQLVEGIEQRDPELYKGVAGVPAQLQPLKQAPKRQ